jgi:hypothetical protein
VDLAGARGESDGGLDEDGDGQDIEQGADDGGHDERGQQPTQAGGPQQMTERLHADVQA